MFGARYTVPRLSVNRVQSQKTFRTGLKIAMAYVTNLKMFVRVYELGSMSAAARDQRTSPAVASGRIAELETASGRAAVQPHHAHGCSPPKAGGLFYDGARNVLSAIDEAEAAVVLATIQNPRGVCSSARRWGWGGGCWPRRCPRSRRSIPRSTCGCGCRTGSWT
jgi:DNA-binding transcriptional LysR family regulator